MSAISIITEAIENAATEGIAIEPGACFDWVRAPSRALSTGPARFCGPTAMTPLISLRGGSA